MDRHGWITFGTSNDYGTTVGIVAQGTKNLSVAGCNFKNNSPHGIYLNFSNLGLKVLGNTITDPHDTTYSAPSCIFVQGNGNQGFIAGNTFRYENAALATYVAVDATRIQSTLTGLGLDFGPSSFQGIDSTHLGLTLGTSAGVNLDGWMSANGTSALVANTVLVTFSKRFPATPKVFPAPTSDLNPVRISAVSTTGFTASGSGTTGFNWRATT